MYCSKCGANIPDGTSFCSKCGNKVQTIIDKSEDNNSQNLDENNNNNKDILSFKNMTDNYGEYSNLADNKKNNNEIKNNSQISYLNNGDKDKILKEKRKKRSKIPLIIAAFFVITIIVIGVIFRNNIKCVYYTSKYNRAVDIKIKEEYAEKAFTSSSNDSTKKMIKDSLTALSEQDAEIAEKKLDEIKDKITMNDYKELACSIKSQEIAKFCKNSQYEDALSKLEEMVSLGENIRKNKNYDDIMLNTCAKLTGNSVRGSKNLLMEEDNMYYDNLDSASNFDDIIEVKNSSTVSNSTIKVNLYTYSDGKYKQVDTKSFSKSYGGKIEGVYICDKVNDEDKKALYMYYEGNTSSDSSSSKVSYRSSSVSSTHCKGISVLGVSDDKLCIIANVMGNKDISYDDFNNDDIYEIFSKSTNDAGWFKVFWDGAIPQKIADENGSALGDISEVHQSSQTINLKTSDYIFSYSNTIYLTDYNLKDLDKNTLALARNEIFARHGFVFGVEPFVTYFNNKTWYTPNPNFKGDDSELNEYEKTNFRKIQEWEAK